MPHYAIELIPMGTEQPGMRAAKDREVSRFTSLGEALQRAREMYQGQNASSKGFRVFNAAGELLHEWKPPNRSKF